MTISGVDGAEGPYSSTAGVLARRPAVYLTSTGRGDCESFVRNSHLIFLNRLAAHGTGELLWGASDVFNRDDMSVVGHRQAIVWRGASTEVVGFSGLVHGAALQDFFARLDFVETDEGVRLGLPSGWTFGAKPCTFVREIPSLGLCSVRPMTEDLARQLPHRSSGARVAGGELFRSGVGDDYAMVLVNDVAHTSIDPGTVVDLNPQDALAAAQDVTFEWAPQAA